jgi:hypothetical protein
VTRRDGLRVIVNDEESKDDDILENINILKVWQNDIHLVYYCLDDATNLSKNISYDDIYIESKIVNVTWIVYIFIHFFNNTIIITSDV